MRYSIFMILICFSFGFVESIFANSLCHKKNCSCLESLETIEIEQLIACKDCKVLENKLYVQEECVSVHDQEIFVHLLGKQFLVHELFSDELGIFILIPKLSTITPAKCSNGHAVWHFPCRGCGNLICPYRCKCFGDTFPFHS